MPKSVATSKIVVDIEHPKCNNPYLVPAGRNLRSTVDAGRLKHQPIHQALTSLGVIPGERVIYDGEKSVVYLEDRLGYKEFIPLRKEMERVGKSAFGIIDPSVYGSPRPTEEYHMHNDNDRASWLIALIQMNDASAIKVVEGTLPTRAEVDALGEWTKAPFSGFQDPNVYRHKRKPAVATTDK